MQGRRSNHLSHRESVSRKPSRPMECGCIMWEWVMPVENEGVTTVCDPATECSAGLHHCWASRQDIRHPQCGLPEAPAHCTLIFCQVMQAAQIRRLVWVSIACSMNNHGSTGVSRRHASLLDVHANKGPPEGLLRLLGMAVSICRRMGYCHIVEPTVLRLRTARNMCTSIAKLVYACAWQLL